MPGTSEQLQFDAKASREMEAAYTSPMIVTRRKNALGLLNLKPGETVLDIGTGPGYLAFEAAQQVGPSGRVLAIDTSPDMLALARRRCADRPQVEVRESDAVSLPAPSGSIDAAIAVQIYEYVSAMPAALAELHRVLRPGGRAVIVDIDWASLVWEAADRARAERIFCAWDEHLADPYLPRRLAPLLREAGFEVAKVEPYTMLNLSPEPFVVGLSKMIAHFVAGRGGVTREEAAAWVEDITALDAQGRFFYSVTCYMFFAQRV